jgi:tetratricopeptide (TPR) repeat protein
MRGSTTGTARSRTPQGTMLRFSSSWCALIAAMIAWAAPALAGGQMMPGGAGGQIPGGRPSMGGPPPDDSPPQQTTEKPDIAAAKAYKQAMKSLDKAKEYEAAAASAPNADKKAKALEKVDDAYNRALDQFTEALSNKSDMVESWDHVGYVHLKLGAYREAVDDYNHALTLKPDLLEAVEHRAEAFLAVDRLDDVRIAYMDLFNHAPDLAAQLMTAMQKWISDRQADPRGMRSSDIEAFGKWVSEREGIAKQTASLPH